MYTSSGRDIEMSVASTKAFYSQIIAGAILGLCIADLKGRRNDAFISEEIKRLLEIPLHMRKVLAMKSKIEDSARKLAPARTYWAAVGSGPNKASADEIRIKLSELCYKTISSDFVEDKSGPITIKSKTRKKPPPGRNRKNHKNKWKKPVRKSWKQTHPGAFFGFPPPESR